MEIPKIGIPRIDEQHEGLVKAMEDLRKWSGTAYESSAVFWAVSFLEHYAQTHFSEEEEFLRAAGFPNVEGHAREHVAIMERIADLVASLLDAKGDVGADAVISEMEKVVVEHIRKEDAEYADFVAHGR